MVDLNLDGIFPRREDLRPIFCDQSGYSPGVLGVGLEITCFVSDGPVCLTVSNGADVVGFTDFLIEFDENNAI